MTLSQKEAASYMKGAVMAYRDCHDFATHLSLNLPEELKFLSVQFGHLAEAFAVKANTVESMLYQPSQEGQA